MRQADDIRLPERADLTRAVPLAGGRSKPVLLLVDSGRGRFAVKDIRALRGLRRLFWRWMLRREARVYEALRGVSGLPPSFGLLDRDALVLGFLDGDVVRRESIAMQGPEFFEELAAIVAAIHERGWVHLDLGHRRNVLVLADGSPAVLDLASCLRVAKVPLVGRVGRWIDYRSVRRLERRYKRRFASSRRAS